MANEPTSFRYPFDHLIENEGTRNALRYAFSGLKDLNDAVKKVNTKVAANATVIEKITSTTVSGGAGPSPPPPPPPLFISISVVIPASAVLALKAAPVQLLAAPGVGSMYKPVLMTYQYKFATTPYTVNAATDQYLCVFAGPQPTVINVRNSFASILANGLMDQASSQIFVAPGLARGAQTVYDNGALMFGLPSDCSAELLAGDGSLTITAEYAVGGLT